MKGFRVETLEQLAGIAENRKAVLATVSDAGTEVRFPAAFIMNVNYQPAISRWLVSKSAKADLLRYAH